MGKKAKPLPIIPAGFDEVMKALIEQKTQQVEQEKAAQGATAPKRRSLLGEVERAVSMGKAPPVLAFTNTMNYTYSRHAQRLHELWAAGDAQALLDYPIKGTNTYSRALRRYREILVAALPVTLKHAA